VIRVTSLSIERRYLNDQAASRQPPRGGHLVWLALSLLALVVYGTGLATGRPELLLGGGVCLALPLLMAQRLEVGLLLVVLVRPSLDVFAEDKVASIHGLSLNPASVLALLVIAMGIPYIGERWRFVRGAPAIRPYLLFAVIAACSILVAPAKGSAITEVLRLLSLVVTYGLVYLVAASSRRALRHVLIAVLGSAALPILWACGQYLFGGSRKVGDLNRLTGTFLHPDPYGIFVALIIVAVVPFALKRGWSNRLLIFALPFAGFALIASYTRTAWVMVLFGVIVIGVVRYRWLLLLVPIMLAGVLVLVPSTGARFNDISNPKVSVHGPGNSLASRIQLWRENLPKVERQPITGLGFGAIVESSSDASHVHSDFIRALVETGIAGFAAYVAVMVLTVAGSLRSYLRRRGDPLLGAVALAGLGVSACYLLASFDSNLMTQVAVSGTAWALIGLAHAAGAKEFDAPAGVSRRTAMPGQVTASGRRVMADTGAVGAGHAIPTPRVVD
jgi:O-antigen ligase